MARPPLFAIAALCLALVGLALPRFSGPADTEPVSTRDFAASGEARAANHPESPLSSGSAGYAAPIASAADESMVLQRATEAVQRSQLELGWSKARTILALALKDATRRLVAGDPVRVAEREVTAHASPLMRWRLAHSTSSAIG